MVQAKETSWPNCTPSASGKEIWCISGEVRDGRDPESEPRKMSCTIVLKVNVMVLRRVHRTVHSLIHS